MASEVAVISVPLAADTEGVLRVGGTRVTLDTVIFAFNEGATPEEIAQRYPSLRLADIYTVIGYYLVQPVEVKEYLRRRQEQAARVRQENEARFRPLGVRERLLARRGAQCLP